VALWVRYALTSPAEARTPRVSALRRPALARRSKPTTHGPLLNIPFPRVVRWHLRALPSARIQDVGERSSGDGQVLRRADWGGVPLNCGSGRVESRSISLGDYVHEST